MAGFTVAGQKYYLNGFYGTAEEHAARQKQQREQASYQAAAPSSQAASSAYQSVPNKKLDIRVDPTGQTSLSNQSEQARMTAQAEAERKAKERTELLNLIRSQGSAKPSATVTHPGVGNNEDARTAAFSRAKDAAGQIARASLTAIAEEMAGRGISGSGIEALRDASALDKTAGGLVEVVRDQAISDAARAGQVNDQVYQGGISQRGQDLANRQSYLALLRSIY